MVGQEFESTTWSTNRGADSGLKHEPVGVQGVAEGKFGTQSRRWLLRPRARAEMVVASVAVTCDHFDIRMAIDQVVALESH